MGAWTGALLSLGQWALNNYANWKHEDYAAGRNYYLSERAADKASQRQAEMYERFYSPSALMRQYNEAGLSPGMMFGGMPGTSGTTGPQGNGGGAAPTYMPLSMMEAAQIDLIKAQTQKTEAETKGVESATTGQNLQNDWQEMLNGEKSAEFELYSQEWYNDDGSPTSLFDMADRYKTFDEFQNHVESKLGRLNEYQQRALRKVYTATYYLDREVAVLTSDKVSADFNKSLITAMKKEDFANWNAKSAVQYLKQNVESNKLDEQQKKAWNDLLERVGRKSETGKDILLIIGMILDKALTQYRLPSIQPTTIQKNVTYNKE